jgi:hypothetical protein
MGVLVTATLQARGAAAWDPLKNMGHSFASGAAEGLQPVLAATIANVDARLGADLDKVGDLLANVDARVGADLDKVGGILDQTVAHVDDSLEKRILQIQHGADETIGELNRDLKERLEQVDRDLAKRIAQVDDVLKGALNQADGIIARQLANLDETVERRLGNVDVIATKQRLAVEQTFLRLAALIGLVVFAVVVLVRLWRRHGEITDDAIGAQATGRRRRVAQALGLSLVLQVGAAGVAAGVLLVLYKTLPMGAARQAEALTAEHERRLTESLTAFDFSQARYHASQLELLRPEKGLYYRAQAAKADLIRDVLARPTLLTSASGVSSIVDRIESVERLLQTEPDPDVLVSKAMLLWQVGKSRRDEHEAASLCARAMRLAPTGFPLAAMARGYIEDFLGAPYFDAGTPFGREAESREGLRDVLSNTEVRQADFPLAPSLALASLMRRLERDSSQAYIAMLEAHAETVRETVRLTGKAGPALHEAQKRRTDQARKVVDAWDQFTRSVDEVPGLAGRPPVLAIFKLNDVYYSRAKWFALDSSRTDVAPLLSPQGRASKVRAAERARLAPPRIAWSRRYSALIPGGLRQIIEIGDSARWRRREQEVRDFDGAMLASLVPGSRDAEALKRKVAWHAARLGLYVVAASGVRVPYATVLLGDIDQATAESERRGEKEKLKELSTIAQALVLREGV